MKAIYKYKLEIVENQVIGLPPTAEVLSVQIQGEQLTLWALVDLNEELEDRHFFIAGTGMEISDKDAEDLLYIATVQHEIYVWHVFEKIVDHYLS